MAATPSVQELQGGKLFKQFLGVIQMDISDFIPSMKEDFTTHANDLLQQLLKLAGTNTFDLFTRPCVYRPVYDQKRKDGPEVLLDVGVGVAHILATSGCYSYVMEQLVCALHDLDSRYSKDILEIKSNDSVLGCRSILELIRDDVLEVLFNVTMSNDILRSMIHAKTAAGFTFPHRAAKIGRLMDLTVVLDEMSVSDVLDILASEHEQRSILYVASSAIDFHPRQFTGILWYLEMRCRNADIDQQRLQRLLVMRNAKGRTVLHRIVRYANIEFLRTLIAVSPSGGSMEISIRDNNGMTALDLLDQIVAGEDFDLEETAAALQQQKLLQSIEPYLLTKGAK
jgi:hypothetical protein